jgi:hypothetical protein
MFGNLATSQRPMVLRARLATGLPLSHRRRTLRAYSICIDSRRKYTGVRSCKKKLSKVYVSDPLYLHESQTKGTRQSSLQRSPSPLCRTIYEDLLWRLRLLFDHALPLAHKYEGCPIVRMRILVLERQLSAAQGLRRSHVAAQTLVVFIHQ